MLKIRRYIIIVVVGGDAGVEKFSEELTLSSHFSSHMVLQRAPARAMVWGAVGSRDSHILVLTLTPATGGPNVTYTKNVTKGGEAVLQH